jgi:hypothetical protein
MNRFQKNVETKKQGLVYLKELKSVEFEERFETGKLGQDILKIVGMDKNFNILGYAIIDLN